jgi:ABC-type glycerol-3-phosphate transport system substrate-binding protein
MKKTIGTALRFAARVPALVATMPRVIILSALLFALGCVSWGCGGGDTGYDPLTNKKVILIWESYNPEEHNVFVEITKRFEEENPGVAVRVARLPWMGQEAKYRTSLIAGRPPDIGRIDTTFLPELVSNDVLAELSAYLGGRTLEDFAAQYVPAAFDSNVLVVNGQKKLFGIPDQTNGVCLFINKALFRAAGLDPNVPPKTWDEFLKYAVRLTNFEKNQFGCGLDNSLWWTFPFLNSYGARFLSEDGRKCLLDDTAAVEAMQFKVDLYKKHGVEGGAWTQGGQNPEIGFLNGRYAMIFMGPWNVARFKSAKLDFGVALVPAGPAGSSTNVGGTNMVVFKKSRNPELAFKFLEYLTSPVVQAFWANKLGQIPVNLKAFPNVDTSKNPELAVFMEQMKTAVARPKVLHYGRLEEIVNPMMEAMLHGDKGIKEGFSEAARRIENEVLGGK